MGRGILLWMLGVPIPIIILLALIANPLNCDNSALMGRLDRPSWRPICVHDQDRRM